MCLQLFIAVLWTLASGFGEGDLKEKEEGGGGGEKRDGRMLVKVDR